MTDTSFAVYFRICATRHGHLLELPYVETNLACRLSQIACSINGYIGVRREKNRSEFLSKLFENIACRLSQAMGNVRISRS